MRVRAVRGVCVGSEDHLKPGEVRDLDAATAQYLVAIGAVTAVIDPPSPPVTDQAVEVSSKPIPTTVGNKKKEG